MVEKNLADKKIAIIIAFRDFRDEEYFIPKQVLEEGGAKVITVSTSQGTAIGSLGGDTKVDILLKDLKVSDFDAVVFIGGPGAPKYLDKEESYRVAKETISQNKVLAAICIAPAILAKAGVLEGKRATVWSSSMDKSAIKILEDNKAEYLSELVVVDDNIVTGDGPAAAQKFGEKIVEVLTRG